MRVARRHSTQPHASRTPTVALHGQRQTTQSTTTDCSTKAVSSALHAAKEDLPTCPSQRVSRSGPRRRLGLAIRHERDLRLKQWARPRRRGGQGSASRRPPRLGAVADRPPLVPDRLPEPANRRHPLDVPRPCPRARRSPHHWRATLGAGTADRDGREPRREPDPSTHNTVNDMNGPPDQPDDPASDQQSDGETRRRSSPTVVSRRPWSPRGNRWRESAIGTRCPTQVIDRSHGSRNRGYSILSFAVTEELVEYNAGAAVKKPRYTRAREPHIFMLTDVEAIHSKLGDRDRALVSVLAYSGPRPGEVVCRLTWNGIGERAGTSTRSAIGCASRPSSHRWPRICAGGSWPPGVPRQVTRSRASRSGSRASRSHGRSPSPTAQPSTHTCCSRSYATSPTTTPALPAPSRPPPATGSPANPLPGTPLVSRRVGAATRHEKFGGASAGQHGKYFSTSADAADGPQASFLS